MVIEDKLPPEMKHNYSGEFKFPSENLKEESKVVQYISPDKDIPIVTNRSKKTKKLVFILNIFIFV